MELKDGWDSPRGQVLGKDILGKGPVELFLEPAFSAQEPESSLAILEHMLHALERWGLGDGSLGALGRRLSFIPWTLGSH